MKKRVIVAVGVTVILAIVIACTICNRPYYVGTNGKPVKVEEIAPNDWQPYKAIDPADSTHVYRVIWSQKYGSVQTAYCKVVFRNDKEKQYKLIAPWLSGIEIERANMDDIQFDRIPLDSVPEEVLKLK
jgi:hypothetical protein